MKARCKCHPSAFRTGEPRSPPPHEQDAGLFQPCTPAQSRRDLLLAAFGIAAARRGRTMPGRFGPFSQTRDCVHRPTISSLARHRPARNSPFPPRHPPRQSLPLCRGLFLRSHLPVAPKGALARRHLAVSPPSPSRGLPGERGVGLGQGRDTPLPPPL